MNKDTGSGKKYKKSKSNVEFVLKNACNFFRSTILYREKGE